MAIKEGHTYYFLENFVVGKKKKLFEYQWLVLVWWMAMRWALPVMLSFF